MVNNMKNKIEVGKWYPVKYIKELTGKPASRLGECADITIGTKRIDGISTNCVKVNKWVEDNYTSILEEINSLSLETREGIISLSIPYTKKDTTTHTFYRTI